MPDRISTAQIYDTGQSQVGIARSKESSTAEKSTTLKELNRPSDNPGDWRLVRSLQDQVSLGDTLSKDAHLGNNLLATTDVTLSELQENIQRTHELTLSVCGEGPQVAGTRRFVLGEIKQLFNSTLQLANLRFGGRTIFSGMNTQSPAFSEDGKYLGDTGALNIEVAPGLKLPVNVTGDRIFLGTGIKDGVNIMEMYQRLIKGLENDDTQMIQGTLEDMTRANSQVSFMRSEVGGRMAAIKRAIDTQGDARLPVMDSLSQLQDADAVKVFSELARDKAVLQSAMGTTHKLLAENPADQLFK